MFFFLYCDIFAQLGYEDFFVFRSLSRMDNSLLFRNRVAELDFMVRYDIADSEVDRKSPLKAAILSAILPGAGELYSGSYIKAFLFFAVEVVSWTVYFTYNSRGDEQTRIFQEYADRHWSVVRYAEWINRWVSMWGEQFGISCSITINPNQSLPPWRRVNWSQLNECERLLGFTHILPHYGEQQYYELIGKYHQYAPGWDDFNLDFIPEDIAELSPTRRFLFYSEERGKANKFYTYATWASMVVVVNHILSAFDAALSAMIHNRVKIRADVSYRSVSGIVIGGRVSISF
jgi:hypothetical protein